MNLAVLTRRDIVDLYGLFVSSFLGPGVFPQLSRPCSRTSNMFYDLDRIGSEESRALGYSSSIDGLLLP